jgi:serine protease Do
MIRFISLFSLAFLALQPVAAEARLESFAPIAERVLPAVVNISTTQKAQQSSIGVPEGLEGARREELERFFEHFGLPFALPEQGGSLPQQEVQSLGSGFVIDPQGYVVTNNHVVADASEIVVLFSDDSKLDATLVGRDPKTDLALLKVDSPKPLPYVAFGDSDSMRVGDWVMAIGNPFGLGGTVTSGIISARSRNINAGPFDDFLQTDAAINRGNSGGPMFNMDGNVIGVNAAIFSPSGGNVGIGFAIPSALAKPILDQLREYGRPHRGWLGVKIQHVTEEIANSLGLDRAYGALVLELTPDSPAANAGLESGDVVLSFNGREVAEMRQLPRMVAETPVGETVTVDILRKGKRESVRLKLGEFPEDEELVTIPQKTPNKEQVKEGETVLGMSLGTIDNTVRARYSLGKTQSGVMVYAVANDSEAKMRTVAAGDIIAGVNQDDIASVEDFKRAINAARAANRGYVLVRIKRGNESNYITLPIQ